MIGCGESKETRIQRHLLVGNEKFRLREYEQAERYFVAALALDSCFADALNNLGTIEHKRGNSTRALEYYGKAIRCREDFSLALLNRANVHYEIGRQEDAFRDLEKIRSTYGDSSSFIHLEGLVRWKQREHELAIAAFRRLLLRNPGDRDLLINIGTLRTMQDQYDSGRLYLGRALKIDPQDARALNALAMLEVDAGNIEKGSQLIDKAFQINPKDAYIINNKGYILLIKGQTEEGLALINQSISADPYNGWAYRNKGWYHFLKGNFTEAIRLLKRAEDSDPSMEMVNSWLGQAYLKAGEKQKGCEYLSKALSNKEVTRAEVERLCPK
jgi:tetratricopeptide (TPR) repeat protein